MNSVIMSCAVQSNEINSADWFSAGISICTLLINVLFYIVIAPRIGFKLQKKEDFLKCSSEFLTYLSGVNSFDSFEGVPTKVKSYCVTIKLLFKDGMAPEELSNCMEQVYQLVKARKHIENDKDIWTWEQNFMKETNELRIQLAKYTGVF